VKINLDDYHPEPWPKMVATQSDLPGHDTDGIFQIIFQHSPEAMALTRSQDGALVAVNEEWLRLTGFSRDEVLGRSTVALGHWPDQASCDLVMMSMKTEGRLKNIDVSWQMKDGLVRPVRMSAVSMALQGVPFVVLYIRDISAELLAQEARQATEQVLAKTNEKLRQQVALFELVESLSKAGHWLANPADMPFFIWSKGLYQLTSETEEKNFLLEEGRSRIHPDDVSAYLAARQSLDGSTLNYRWRFSDGRYHWIRTQMRRYVHPDGSHTDLGVVQDFTDEHLAKQGLQDRLNQLQRLTSRLPEMVFQYLQHPEEPGRGRFVFVSDAVQTLFRTSPQEACAQPRHLFKQVHPEDLPALLRSLDDYRHPGAIWSHEFRVCSQSGVVRVLLGKAITFLESNGQLMAYGSITDISEYQASQTSLRDSESRFRALTELSSDWYWEQDAQFRFIRVDGHLDVPNVLPVQTYVGATRWDSQAPGISQAQWAKHRAALAAHETFHDFEMQRQRSDGSPVWVAVSGTPIFEVDGRFNGYRGIGRDISVRKEAEIRIERLAFYDVLTALPNRRLLMNRLQQALGISGREGTHGALLFIDLDNFKALNDTQGHDVGDLLLVQVAQRLAASVREVDTVARLGGDEFVVMLQGLNAQRGLAMTEVEQVGKKIRDQLNQVYLLGTLEHHSTPSIGVTLFEGTQQTLDELLKQADVAMYEAKAAGRNTLQFFDPAMLVLVAQRTVLELELRHGLPRGELIMFYQPVVNVTSQVVGVEALVRWQHPRLGLVLPPEFIPMAENSALILPLAQWVLETVCTQLKSWSTQASTSGLSIAVNVSARQFRQAEFVPQVLALLQASGASPQRLKLELTERLLLSDTSDAILKMSQLQALGVSFSLDDFGTGYSSLSNLKQLPLQQLKIDQSFVRDLLTNTNAAAIVRTVLALGQSLDYSVVAEGVETEAQRDFLLENGCTLFQGFLFGKPVPIEELKLGDLSPGHLRT
jgi:diguanylate cyclase (GGDEF)-like protein/PAS domain S-box-containing protein